MSDPEEKGGFLGRWSRLKQEAQKSEPEQPDARGSEVTENPADGTDETTSFDPSKLEIPLPGLDDIVPGMNMTPFFQKGVPETLRNAALRKLWVTDPAIRDFENPAREYAYDWNVPGGVPGSGEIVGDHDVAELLRGMMGKPEERTGPEDIPSQPMEPVPSDHLANAKSDSGVSEKMDAGADVVEESEIALPQGFEDPAPTDRVEAPVFATAKGPRGLRRHGGALPESG